MFYVCAGGLGLFGVAVRGAVRPNLVKTCHSTQSQLAPVENNCLEHLAPGVRPQQRHQVQALGDLRIRPFEHSSLLGPHEPAAGAEYVLPEPLFGLQQGFLGNEGAGPLGILAGDPLVDFELQEVRPASCLEDGLDCREAEFEVKSEAEVADDLANHHDRAVEASHVADHREQIINFALLQFLLAAEPNIECRRR